MSKVSDGEEISGYTPGGSQVEVNVEINFEIMQIVSSCLLQWLKDWSIEGNMQCQECDSGCKEAVA